MTVPQTTPPTTATTPSLAQQSLSRGDFGTALLWAARPDGTAQSQALQRAARAAMPLLDGPHAGIFLGAPALTFVLHIAGWKGAGMDRLDAVVAAHVRGRLAAAHDRIDARQPAAFAEYDLMHGLAGVGTLLLARSTDLETTKALLTYLVRLTDSSSAGNTGPGWWVWHQHSAPDRPGAHANAGLAHGITGPLAVLALAIRRNVRVPGDLDAIGRVLDWLDDNRHPDGGWARWTDDHDTGPRAPSWCYGTPGIARAQQLAAIVTGDATRKQAAEKGLLECLADSARLDALTGSGLCHGPAGTLQVVRRVADDADDPGSFEPLLTELTNRLRSVPEPRQPGLLEGLPGVRLVLDHPPAPHAFGWDACLGIA